MLKDIIIARRHRNKDKVFSIRKRNRKRNSTHVSRIAHWSRLVEHWSKFCEYSTFAGFRLIGSKKRRVSASNRIILLLIWIAILCFGCNLCGKYLTKYLQYNVKTSIRYDGVSKQRFPAITFCNSHSFKKSIVGLNDDFIAAVSKLVSKDNKDFISLVIQNRKICKFQTGQSEKLKQTDELYSSLFKHDYERIFESLALDLTMNVQKCWWNNTEINCSKHFINHYVDEMMCFTFNQDPSILTSNGLFPVFGSDEYQSENLFVHTTRQQNGLKLLLNANQQEYCETRNKRSGAGFSILVHDAQSETSSQLQKTLLLSPGFEYDLSLQPVQYDIRNFSEWLGKCTSYQYNFLKPNLTTYNQYACLQACLIEIVWRECNCLLIEPKLVSNSVIHHFSTSKTCDPLSWADAICYMDLRDRFNSKNTNEFRPHCKQKCLEIKYEYILSSKKLSLSKVRKLISDSIHTNESVKKNFILLSIHLETMDLMTVQESQLITPLALFIYWSNILCLSLGFTVITIPELAYYILTTLLILFKILMESKP